MGNGLHHMKERAQSSGFNISIESEKGKGTEVKLQLAI